MARSRRRRRPRDAKLRKKRAKQSQSHLEEIVKQPWSVPNEMANSAARDMLRISRRHQLGLPAGRRIWICRECKSLLRPSKNCRVRIRKRRCIVTCLKCGRQNRCGPDFPKSE